MLAGADQSRYSSAVASRSPGLAGLNSAVPVGGRQAQSMKQHVEALHRLRVGAAEQGACLPGESARGLDLAGVGELSHRGEQQRDEGVLQVR